MGTTKTPISIREKLMQERESLYAHYDALQSAISEILSGEATASYTIGNRSTSVTRANLNDLQNALRWVQNRIDEIEALLNGRAVRSIQTHSFLQPSQVFWRW